MDKIHFTVNGDQYSLSGGEVSPETTLNEFLRNRLQLFGTKAMCHEGGCGACAVAVRHTHPVSKEKHVFSVNSCLVHVLSCHQWEITTIEGLGNRRVGYHPLQARLAAFNGTQCGYCSPGWVMSMYSVYEGAQRKVSAAQLERAFGGNMCRCTGYRPILDAFKTFATDADPRLLARIQVVDVEEVPAGCPAPCGARRGSGSGSDADDWCVIHADAGARLVALQGDNYRWYKAYTVKDIFQILAREGTSDYTLVAGNTGKGVFWAGAARVQVDIASVEELRECLRDANLELGAAISITEMMEQCKKWKTASDFRYLDEFYNHLDLVAHVPLRNIGSIGGNLAMKNRRPEYPSDIFLLLETVQATVTVVNSSLEKKELSMADFLQEDLTDKLIYKVQLPPLAADNLVRTYKIMPRAQNAHAVVNAGFLFKVDGANKVQSATLVFGNISAGFQRARRTETALRARILFADDVLQLALRSLADELAPAPAPPEPDPRCRKNLALGLFYKAILSLCGDASPRHQSGGEVLMPGESRGTQSFDTDKSQWPINQPVIKLEARAQKQPGVVGFFTAADIPGRNTFIALTVPWQEEEEEILASESVSYYGQPVALVAAVTRRAALLAVDKVRVAYEDAEYKPVLNIRDALAAPDRERRVHRDVVVERKGRGDRTVHTVKGSYNMGAQYHYTMEPQSCHCEPGSRGLRVRSATQWMDLVQVAVAQMLALPQNKVAVEVEHVGGAYGGKASRSALVACACALVAHKLDRPAQLVLPMRDNMLAVGKRGEFEADYELGVDSEGEIQYLDVTYYTDCGCSFNDSPGGAVAEVVAMGLYSSERFQLTGYSVLTDKASNTWCRAPATTEATALMEHIMERIAHVTNKDPFAVRVANLSAGHEDMRDVIDTFKRDCEYDQRLQDVGKYNSENAWKKRALRITLMSYPIDYSGPFYATISIYYGDGSVEISHAGIEMGQGINTKVAQVCAAKLNIPLEKVAVRDSDTFTSPNALATNGSLTSESVAFAATKACEELNRRLDKVRRTLVNPTWEEVVKAAHKNGVNLQASYMTDPNNDKIAGYNIYGACAVEVELDVLTGQHVIRRADVFEDTGVSLSPDIDVGQVEGAFVMGLGLWTSERLQMEAASGRLLTDRSWNYKPPGAQDVPRDFRVAFRRSSPNPFGVLGSKATGEPALVLAVAVAHALHAAIRDARKEFGYDDAAWLHVRNPYTLETILNAISPKTEYFKLK